MALLVERTSIICYLLMRKVGQSHFFSAFEKLMTQHSVPSEQWTKFVTAKLSGRALIAYNKLTIEEAKDYKVVKSRVLKAFELVPEAYRQKFRTIQRSKDGTHLDLAEELSLACDRWVEAALTIKNYDTVIELLKLEQFKNLLNSELHRYIDDKNVTTLHEAAVQADQWELTHQVAKNRHP